MQLDILIFKFGITFLLALLFGIERQRSHKPIGFGTFIFVAIGACGLAITATELNSEGTLGLLGSIVTGIGFLGAGALIRTTDKIFGFTTAASIWVFSIIGLLIGIGQYILALLTYVIIWFTILIDKYLELRGIGSYQKKLIIKTNKIISDKEIKNVLTNNFKNYKLISMDIDKLNHCITFNYLIRCGKDNLNNIPNILYKLDWLGSYRIE